MGILRDAETSKKLVFVTANRLRLTGNGDQVEVKTSENDTVTVELGAGASEISIVGTRYDVHRLIIEADRQLSRLADRWA